MTVWSETNKVGRTKAMSRPLVERSSYRLVKAGSGSVKSGRPLKAWYNGQFVSLGAISESRNSSRLPWSPSAVCMWCVVDNVFNKIRASSWDLLKLPSFFYRSSETRWHRRACRAIYKKVWKSDGRRPEKATKYRAIITIKSLFRLI